MKVCMRETIPDQFKLLLIILVLIEHVNFSAKVSPRASNEQTAVKMRYIYISMDIYNVDMLRVKCAYV